MIVLVSGGKRVRKESWASKICTVLVCGEKRMQALIRPPEGSCYICKKNCTSTLALKATGCVAVLAAFYTQQYMQREEEIAACCMDSKCSSSKLSAAS